MAKRRIKKRFFVFIGLILAMLGAVLFVAMGGGGENVIEYGSITYEKTEEVVLLRDEKVMQAANYAKVIFHALEGERVNNGQKIMEIYKWGYNDALFTELLNKQQEIMKYQEEMQQDIINEEVDTLNENIRVRMDAIAARVQGESRGDMLSLERELIDAMEARRTFLKESLQPTQELTQLYETEQSLIDRIEMYKLDVLAEEQGIVSFYFDGSEHLLTPALLNDLTQEDVSRIAKGAAPKTTESRVEKPIYRMVSNLRWYCLLPRSKDDDKIPLVDKGPYDIVFAGYYDTPYTGTLEKINKSEGGTLYIFEMNSDVGALIGVRNIQATIKCSFEGLKVPLKALHKRQDKEGIFLQNGAEKTFVPVTVVIRDAQSAIIRPEDESVVIQPGQHFTSP